MDSLLSNFPDLTFFPLRKPSGFHPETITLEVGHSKEPGRRCFDVDCTFERDTTVVLRDGAKIYTDVFRPQSACPERPVPGIIAWSPYGKANPRQTYDHMGPLSCGLQPNETSGYQKFEGLDPADWCARGYAIINPDARGAGFSEGNIALWGDQEANDFHDLIDWVSKQNWCNGSVGTAGNSWLAIAQINVAARDPHPALKAIAPWEAATDGYRDFIARGGIPRGGFMPLLYKTMTGTGAAEDGSAMVEKRPLFDKYWKTKVIPVEQIDIPMYLTASYSTLLHSRESFETFLKAKSAQKMVTGSSHTGVPSTNNREAPSFPLPGTDHRMYYLNAQDNSMVQSRSEQHSTCSYEAHDLKDSADFRVTFDTHTELAGYPHVKLWISCMEHDDMDVHVQIRKIGRNGEPLVSLNYPVPVAESYVDNANVSKFLGCDGMLRASHRVSKSSLPGEFPVYKHDRSEKIAPGSVVELDIPFWPIGMVFEAGEGIMLRVSGHELRLPELAALRSSHPTDKNIGTHWIHTGGNLASYLVVPAVTRWVD